MRRIVRRLGFSLLAVSTLLVYWAGLAFAHITVEPESATVGGETVFTFRVPNEQSSASTVKLEFALPTSTPIPVVSVRPLPGWTAHTTTVQLAKPVRTDDGPVSQAVSRITWTADDERSAIAPGQFQEFMIEGGPLPKTKLLLFKVLQYYSDGSVVRWIDPPSAGEEPPHPAPAVTLGSGAAAPPTNSTSGGGSPAVSGDGWIAVAAFVAGLLGLAAGTSALVRVRRGTRGSQGADRE